MSTFPIVNQSDTTLVDSMVEKWVEYFHKADSQIEWIATEQEHTLWLNDNTVVLGKVDAIGRTDGDLFFADWKTSGYPGKYRAEDWKASWGLNPQSLTYGVLLELTYPGLRRFTVRKAYKTTPPQFSFAWFKYSTEELNWWRSELIELAEEIRRKRARGRIPWATPNVTNCFRYGPKYVCPFYHPACSKLDWDGHEGLVRKAPHLEVESKVPEWKALHPDLVVLGASIVEDYLICSERYRRRHEDGWDSEPGEALQVGADFHNLLDAYYKRTFLEKSK